MALVKWFFRLSIIIITAVWQQEYHKFKIWPIYFNGVDFEGTYVPR